MFVRRNVCYAKLCALLLLKWAHLGCDWWNVAFVSLRYVAFFRLIICCSRCFIVVFFFCVFSVLSFENYVHTHIHTFHRQLFTRFVLPHFRNTVAGCLCAMMNKKQKLRKKTCLSLSYKWLCYLIYAFIMLLFNFSTLYALFSAFKSQFLTNFLSFIFFFTFSIKFLF